MKKVIILGICFLLLPCCVFSQVDNMRGKRVIDRCDKTISVDFQGVTLMNLCKVISQQSSLNFVASEAVQERTVTLYMENVQLAAAMDILFNANNLTYDFHPQANIFVIREMGKPGIERVTKVYNLKYARVKKSRLQQEIDDLIADEDSEDTEAEDGITAAVREALTENGKVIEDAITNALIVIDVPSQFRIIDQIIASLDVQQPKVLIEVEILDVSKNLVDEMGVDWPTTLASLDVTGRRATRFPFFGNKAGNENIDYTVTSPGAVAMGTLGSNHFTPSILTVIGAELALDFLKTDNSTKSLARPKILTLSNETAEIKITTDEAIGVQQNVDENGNVNYTVERTETGTRLRVTPQVNPQSGEITLIVESVEKQATDSGFQTTGTSYISGTIKDPEERSTKAVVRIKNGEVLLLGGLIKRTETDNRTSVPGISNIPLLGNLFKHKRDDVDDRELLIFITPRLVEESQFQFSRAVRTLDREQSMVNSKQEAVQTALDRFQLSGHGKTR